MTPKKNSVRWSFRRAASKLAFALVALAVVVGIGCGSSSTPKHPDEKRSLERPNRAWKRVPANTAVLFASKGRFADSVAKNYIEPMLKVGRRVKELEGQGVDARAQVPDGLRELLTAVEVFFPRFVLDQEALEASGLGEFSRYIVYNVDEDGLVLAVELAAPERFETRWQRAMDKLGDDAGISRGGKGDGSWYSLDFFPSASFAMGMTAAVRGDQFLLVVHLAEQRNKALAHIDETAVATPIDHKAVVGELRGFFDGDSYGYFDFREVLRVVYKLAEGPAACEDKVAHLAEGVPRMIFATDSSKTRMVSKSKLELRPDLAKGLKSFVVDSPMVPIAWRNYDYGRVSFNVAAALRALQIKVTDVKADLMQCKELDTPELLEFFEQAETGLKTVMFAPHINFQSALFAIPRFDDNREAASAFVLRHDNPLVLYSMLASDEFLGLNSVAPPMGTLTPLVAQGGADGLIRVEKDGIAWSYGLTPKEHEPLSSLPEGPGFLDAKLNIDQLAGAEELVDREKFELEGVYDPGLQDALFELREDFGDEIRGEMQFSGRVTDNALIFNFTQSYEPTGTKP